MRKVFILVSLLSLIFGVSSAQMQNDVETPAIVIPNSQELALTSETNGHDYRISVVLPDSYATSEESYPVLFVLDPLVALQSVREVVRWLSYWGELPELIIVGIGYPTDDIGEIVRPRERDYAVSDDDFLEFISEELFSLVDSTYRTDSADRGLIGFSYGADLVFHTLVSQPQLFNRYAAIDGSAGEMMSFIISDEEAFRSFFVGRNVKLFISATGTEIASGALQNKEFEGLEATGFSLGDVTHAAALHLSLPAGIMAIYSD